MRIKIIIAGIVMALFSISCEDFLTLDSTSALSTAVYFKSEADFTNAVNGIYADLRTFHGINIAYIGDMHSDNARYFYNDQRRGATSTEGDCDFVYSYTAYSTYWTTFYSWINRANQVLYYIDDVTFNDQAYKDNLKGQALFMRAYAYFWVVRLYGQAVLHLEPVNSVDQANMPLSTAAVTIAQIKTDAGLAITLLPVKSAQTNTGRVTKGSAQMLLGDVCIWDKDWANAEDVLTDLESSGEYGLLSSFGDVFEVNKKNNAESIFEIQYSASIAYASSLLYNCVPQPMAKDSVAKLMGTTDAKILEGSGWDAPTPNLINKFEAGDARLAETIKYVWYGYSPNYFYAPMNAKYLHKHSLHGQPDNNFIVYRYAETLLLLAEAINEQPGGRQTEALAYLKQVRQRALLGDSPALTQEEVRQAIIDERQVELAFEGKRFFDLVRTGTFENVITAYGEDVAADPAAYYLVNGGTLPTGAFQDFRTTFNLPIEETEYNTEIK